MPQRARLDEDYVGPLGTLVFQATREAERRPKRKANLAVVGRTTRNWHMEKMTQLTARPIERVCYWQRNTKLERKVDGRIPDARVAAVLYYLRPASVLRSAADWTHAHARCLRKLLTAQVWPSTIGRVFERAAVRVGQIPAGRCKGRGRREEGRRCAGCASLSGGADRRLGGSEKPADILLGGSGNCGLTSGTLEVSVFWSQRPGKAAPGNWMGSNGAHRLCF